jgi:hypothetical protein
VEGIGAYAVCCGKANQMQAKKIAEDPKGVINSDEAKGEEPMPQKNLPHGPDRSLAGTLLPRLESIYGLASASSGLFEDKNETAKAKYEVLLRRVEVR